MTEPENSSSPAGASPGHAPAFAAPKPPSWTSRRVVLFTLSLFTIVGTTAAAHELLSANSLSRLEMLWLVIFVLSFGWIALAFWTQAIGAWRVALNLRTRGLLWPTDAEAKAPLSARTALLIPVHNEDSVTVFGRLHAMYEDLQASGFGDAFDFFVLSDSTDTDAWLAEEREWSALTAKLGQGRVFYRRRAKNTAKKAGNISDFCRRWGGRYETMVILDADSLMTAKTLIVMARLMEKNTRAGIIQAPPMAVGSRTIFARIQQFAGYAYGVANGAGLAWWQGGDSNYWGHNAIIRVKPFMDHCELPVLPGKPPFGGHILSHDFVEAALIRRGGYSVWLLPELDGSYEQLPPSIIDYAARDRRWCQGNLQHFPLIAAHGLHWVSRLHFAFGVMAYASSVICLALFGVGFWLLVVDKTTPTSYFSADRTLFPNWKTFDHDLAIRLGVLSIVLLVLPKMLSLAAQLVRPESRKGMGGVVRGSISGLLEIIWAALLSPSMMLFQSNFVLTTLLGGQVAWGAQHRDERRISWEEAFERQGGHMLLGIVLFAGTWMWAPSLLPWLIPLVGGLLLSVPMSIYSASATLGVAAQKLGLFLTPPEVEVPAILTRSDALTEERKLELGANPPDVLTSVLNDPQFNAVHLAFLAIERPPRADGTVLSRASEKVLNQGPTTLTVEERRALLSDGDALLALHLRLLEVAPLPPEPAAGDKRQAVV